MAVRNPYAAVDWAGVTVPGLTHAHGTTLASLQEMLADGYEALAFANYYPTDPSRAYPLTNMTGVTGADIPAGVIGLPNGEHHSFTDCGGHVCGIGSTLVSGSSVADDPPDGTGYEGPWRTFIADFEGELLYPNGGGISLNHPHLSFMGTATAIQMLDYSELVLGIEVFNHLGEWYYGGLGWALDVWHDILKTGRRCYGFGAPDHVDVVGAPAHRQGYNRLLVPASYATDSTAQREQAALEAYRNGEWYVAIAEASPELTGITVDDTSITVDFAASCDIKFVYAKYTDQVQRESAVTTGTSATYNLRGDEIYVRAVGTGAGADEIALTQAIMFMDATDINRKVRGRRFVALG